MARYRHPQHGFHIVGYGDDLAALRAAGWVLDEPAPVAPHPPVPESVPALPAPAPAVATPPLIRRGPGRSRRSY